MFDHDVPEDLLNCDWEQLLDSVPDDWSSDLLDHGPLLSTSSDSGCSLSLERIEQFLLNDDDDDDGCLDVQADKGANDDVVALDLSPESETNQSKDTPSPETPAGEDGRDEEKAGGDALNKEENKDVDLDGEDDDDNDPAAKKRKRQIRNRDAAVRSRERKKMYVKDLEMKSKYYESECRRLGILLQCCMAENQALRLSLHSSKACDASMAKQESAVLFLELLLLGSLLGSLGIMCLLLSPLLSNLEKLQLDVGLELARIEPRTTSNGFFRVRSSTMGRTCKASRTRIKPQLVIIV